MTSSTTSLMKPPTNSSASSPCLLPTLHTLLLPSLPLHITLPPTLACFPDNSASSSLAPHASHVTQPLPLTCSPRNCLLPSLPPGGFTSSWLAMTYPTVKGLLLDATFDDLEPLAIPRLAKFSTRQLYSTQQTTQIFLERKFII